LKRNGRQRILWNVGEDIGRENIRRKWNELSDKHAWKQQRHSHDTIFFLKIRKSWALEKNMGEEKHYTG